MEFEKKVFIQYMLNKFWLESKRAQIFHVILMYNYQKADSCDITPLAISDLGLFDSLNFFYL